MTAFTSKVFYLWIKKVKEVAIKTKIWDYVDPTENKSELVESEFSKISDYIIEKAAPMMQRAKEVFITNLDPSVRWLVNKITKFSDKQRKLWKIELSAYQAMKKQHNYITHKIRIIGVAIKALAQLYILSKNIKSTMRKILQILSIKYKRLNFEIIE